MSSRGLDATLWQRVAPYLDHALDLAAGDREAWLDTTLGPQTEIAAVVRELLAAYEDPTAQGFLEHSPFASFNRATRPGQRVGAYTIESLLGRGGMGEVWLASRDDGRFEGHCAIKFLEDTRAKPNLANRFRREAHLLARLVHPHIARLLDAGTTEEDRHYLVLEHVDGERIDHYCRSRVLSIEARLRLFLDVIAAVAHAHTNLIIHRDLKPTNVLVTRKGEVKLLDFGIAKLMRGEPLEQDPADTRVDEIALTPEYAAPEQILGAPPSTATDVYQLGMLLFVLLTGRHPGPGVRQRAALASTLVEDELPRASSFSGPWLQRRLRGDLDAILSKALRRDPQERYPTAVALAEDLQRHLDGEPVLALRGGVLYRARKFIRRHRFAMLGTTIAVSGLCASLVFALAQAHEAGRQRDQARHEAKRADAHNRFLKLAMAGIGEPGKPITSEQMLENAEQLLEERYGEDPPFVIDMLFEIAGRYTDLGEREREHAVLVKAEGLARRQQDPLSIADTQCTLVPTEIALGHLDRAEVRLAEAQRLIQSVPHPPVENAVNCQHAGAFVAEASGRPMEAINIIAQGVAALEAADATGGDIYTSLVSHLGDLYGSVGNTAKALEFGRKHRAAEQAKYGKDTLGILLAMHNDACLLYDLGELQAALAEEKEVLQRQAATRSGVMPAIVGTYSMMLIRLDQAEAALPWLEQSLSTADRVGDVRSSLQTRIRRAVAFHTLGREMEAAAELDAVDRAASPKTQDGRYAAARSMLVRAWLLADRGNLEEAYTRAETVLALATDASSGYALLLDEALLTVSRIAAARGLFDEAETRARDALRRNETRARDPAQSANVGEATLVLAQIKAQLGEHGESRALAGRAAVALSNSLGTGHRLTKSAMALASG